MKPTILSLVLLATSLVCAQDWKTYSNGEVSFSHPSDWVVSGNSGLVVIAPVWAQSRSRSGKTWISTGLYFISDQSSYPTVDAFFYSFVAKLRTQDAFIRPLASPRHIDAGGLDAISQEYENSGPEAPAPEQGRIVTVRRSNGRMVGFVFFAPKDQFSGWSEAFDKVFASLRVSGISSSGIAEKPEIYVEPWQSLLHGTYSVRAGQAVHFQMGLQQGTALLAQFHVSGGLNDQLEVLLLDTPNFQRFSAGQPFNYFQGTAGTVRGLGQYQFRVPRTDNYYLVLNNAKAWFMPRSVALHVDSVMNQPTQASSQIANAYEKEYLALARLFTFPKFKISIQHCGTSNAFSNPNITLCVELIDELLRGNHAGTINFVFFHELGHTFLRQWGYPGYDNEDMADEFATVFMMMTQQKAQALDAAQYWVSQTESAQDAVSKIWLDDRHTLSPQRARNIVHWLNNEQDLVRRWQKAYFIPNLTNDALQQLARDPGPFDQSQVQTELKRRQADVVAN